MEELNNLLEYLEEDINFIIAGYAADNASFIFNKKIDMIDKITTSLRKYTYREEAADIIVKLPDIKVGVLVGKTLIDLSDLINKLDEIIESRLRPTVNIEETPPLTQYFADTVEIEVVADEIGKLLLNAYKIFNKELYLTEIIRTLDNYSPYMILFAILFLYSDGKLDIEVVEEDGIVKDLIIIPVE